MSYRADKLGDGRTDRRTDGRTDGQTQAKTIPEGQNWPQVKTVTFGVFPWNKIKQSQVSMCLALQYSSAALGEFYLDKWNPKWSNTSLIQ